MECYVIKHQGRYLEKGFSIGWKCRFSKFNNAIFHSLPEACSVVEALRMFFPDLKNADLVIYDTFNSVDRETWKEVKLNG